MIYAITKLSFSFSSCKMEEASDTVDSANTRVKMRWWSQVLILIKSLKMDIILLKLLSLPELLV